MSEQTDLGTEDGEEFSELVNANLPRADLVGKGANGIPFLVAKAADGGGLVSAKAIRGLLGEREGQELIVPLKQDHVTISGSPAAVMKMIHEAAQRASSNEKGDAMSEDVQKADGDAPVEVDDLVGDAPGGSTAESVPGSPDWEALDAETALNAVGVLGRVKGALSWLAGREAQEAVTNGDPDDADNAFDLEDAACQLDWIIRCLGAFATTETLEAEVGEELDDVTKAAVTGAAGAVAPLLEALGVVETYGPVMKAGRVLSTANEQLLRGASESIQKVLASLPAPIEDGAAVTKEADVNDTSETVEDVEKAKGDPQVAVYNADGKLVGTVDQADLIPIAAPQAPDGGDEQGASDDSGTDDASAAAAGGDDLAPQPAADAGTPADAGMATAPVADETSPADDVTKGADAGDEQDQEAVLKALVDERVKEALQGYVSAEEHSTVVKALEGQIADLSALAPSRVLTQGALPPAHQMRGQDQGSSEVEVAKAAELQERLRTTHDVAEREAIQTALNEMAVKAWTTGRAARPGR